MAGLVRKKNGKGFFDWFKPGKPRAAGRALRGFAKQ